MAGVGARGLLREISLCGTHETWGACLVAPRLVPQGRCSLQPFLMAAPPLPGEVPFPSLTPRPTPLGLPPPPDPRTWRAVRPGQEQKGRWAERSVPQELLPSEPEALETEQNDVFCLLILLVWKVLSVLLRRVV